MLRQPGSAVMGSQDPSSPNRKESLPPSINPGKQSQTLCRNILIHGYCKYENSGCIFRHDNTKTNASAAKPETPKKRLNVESPAFKPGSAALSSSAANASTTTSPSKTPILLSQAADSAVFVPRSSTATSSAMPQEGIKEFEPSPDRSMYVNPAVDLYNQKSMVNPSSQPFVPSYSQMPSINSQIAAESQMPQPVSNQRYDYNSMVPYGTAPPDLYYQQAQAAHYQPLQYHLYAPLPPHKINLLPYQRTIQGFFLSDNLREELQRKGEASLQILPSTGLPESLDVYCQLVPLDTNADRSARVLGYPSWVYKAFSKSDGNTYALRRLEGFKLTDEKSIATVQQWRRLSNASMVTLFEAFTTRAFGDSSIIFVYDYHPLSSTLFDTHFGASARYPVVRNANGQIGPSVPEQVLWSYLVQLSSAMKTIHGANLAARVMDPTKIILTSKMRVRLSAVGIMDVIGGSKEPVAKLQAEDLYNLGRLILSIACNNQSLIMGGAAVSLPVLSKSLEFAGKFYSVGLKNALAYLLGSGGRGGEDEMMSSGNVDEFIQLISGFYQQNLNSSLHYQDSLESELAREVENGRLVRLLCKFNFINERPEYDHDPAWSETGDRYLLKLFRDYVFHQTDESGHPVLDMGHVLRCLNKLDAGVEEKVMLVSRDEQSCLIVSYKELKNCVDVVFRDLSRPNG
ncbi:PAB-dependent poly(A)-specific ribonuclease subunit PAN3 [Myxozyma melibiosi]|uniref:PAN2-PAN3 deadenylation complex subunit PAN3 n=1 Tax=Myxozyma melibiosi TaxID=54550 RepID=A0ABR1F1M1_9ASCO